MALHVSDMLRGRHEPTLGATRRAWMSSDSTGFDREFRIPAVRNSVACALERRVKAGDDLHRLWREEQNNAEQDPISR